MIYFKLLYLKSNLQIVSSTDKLQMDNFPFYKQLDSMDCGPTCLRIITKFYGKNISLKEIKEACPISREGSSILTLSRAAESLGFRTLPSKVTFQTLIDEAPLPLIAYWKNQHYVVVYRIEKKYVFISDPAYGKIKLTKEEFLNGWLSSGSSGVILLIEPTPDFYNDKFLSSTRSNSIGFLLKYLTPHKKLFTQLIVSILCFTLLQFIFPFLTQTIVDIGIANNNLSFISLVLIAQLMLYFCQTVIGIIRSWIILHISTRLNISILADFLIKLMRLPIAFFDKKKLGDILQRIGDHSRIERFLTSQTINILFSILTLITFSVVLAFYDLTILFVFLGGSILYIYWIKLFLKKRRELDYKAFDQFSHNQSNLIQLVTGMQEIKLHNFEAQKRWEWERIQARLFHINLKSLSLNNYQQFGSLFINEVKNIVITFLSASLVVKGEITLGMMLAIQYIIAQLNAPIAQMAEFIRNAQDAKISLERLNEIHAFEDEEDSSKMKNTIFPTDGSIKLVDLCFKYEQDSEFILNNINLIIPQGKVTAIVGSSGSGKTTLIKLLLRFYQPTAGKIKLADNNLENFSYRAWRDKCGTVLQDGYIFADTIARNIAVGSVDIDIERLYYSSSVANIKDFIESLPLGFNTIIGDDGIGLSQGQKQRILIARAVYKNPDYLFFDEATNALDSKNESTISTNLNNYFKGKTVIIVAHRLSTVKNADQIVVLEQGKIVEIGTHSALTRNKDIYYELVKNQLSFDN